MPEPIEFTISRRSKTEGRKQGRKEGYAEGYRRGVEDAAAQAEKIVDDAFRDDEIILGSAVADHILTLTAASDKETDSDV